MLDRAFEIKELIINDTAGVLSGALEPSVIYPSVPLGSIYLRGNGNAYIYTSSGWTLVGVSNIKQLEELVVLNNGDYELLFIEDSIAKMEIQ